MDSILADWVVPIEIRMTSVILDFLGIESQVSAITVYMAKGGFLMPVYLLWNCVGWHSFTLFAATLVISIQCTFRWASKFGAIAVGFLVNFLMNLPWITSVAVVAFLFGTDSALIYDDYSGTIIILLWLFACGWLSHSWLLEPLQELPEGRTQEPFLRDVYVEKEAREPHWNHLMG